MTSTRVLAGRYEIEGELGRGGMATVYRARDRVLGRTVAVKVLDGRHARDDRFVARFRREAQAAAGLSHPNVVAVFDTGSQGDLHFIVMEHVEGHTLADVLEREGRLEPGRAARIAVEVCRALEAAHRGGLVHRDVKPGNVMITPEGEVRVMDFGIARAAADERLTQTGLVLGTASYLSPEQARGDEVDARSDIYSLGCVLYEMLCGRPPFAGDSQMAIALRHVNDEPDPPSAVNPDVPADLEAVAMQAMAKDPDDRYLSAASLAAAVAGTAGGEPTKPMGGDTAVLPPSEGPEPPPTDRAGRFLPVVLGVAAIALLVGVALSFLGGDGRGDGEREAAEERPRQERSPSPEPTLPEAETLEDAVAVLAALLAQGVAEESISEEAAGDLEERVGEAMKKHGEGKLDEALRHLEEAHRKVDEWAAADEIDPDMVPLLHDAIDPIAEMMEATPPPSPADDDDEDDDDRGRGGGGNGGGRGRGDDPPGEGEGRGN